MLKVAVKTVLAVLEERRLDKTTLSYSADDLRVQALCSTTAAFVIYDLKYGTRFRHPVKVFTSNDAPRQNCQTSTFNLPNPCVLNS